MTNVSHKYAGNLSFYDYIIDAGGEGDNTSIAAGLTAAGANASVFIKNGAYTETSDCAVLSGQRIYFDSPVITLNGCVLSAAGSSVAAGRVTLEGTGNAANRRLFFMIGDYNNWANCRVILNPTGAGLTVGSSNLVTCIIATAEFNSANILARDLAYNSNTNMYLVYVSNTVSHSRIKVVLDNIDNAGTANISGLRLLTGTTDSYFEAIIDDVTASGAGTGYGFLIDSGANDNTIVGVGKNSDVDLSNGGTNNDVDAYNTA